MVNSAEYHGGIVVGWKVGKNIYISEGVKKKEEEESS